MTLRDIRIKKFYDSDEDDLIKDFYNPALSEAVSYKRIAGYFSSSSFMLSALGLTEFIKNKGQMRLLINVAINKDDLTAIQEGLKNPEKVIESIMINDLNSIKDELINNHIKVLSWMVAKNIIEIKVATINEEGNGIFHQKVGIIEDKIGNCISFSGSDNESAYGWMKNIEEFKVFRKWVEEESEFVEGDAYKFEKFWNDKAKRTKVYTLPEAVKNNLIQLAPNSEQELEDIIKYIRNQVKDAKSEKKPRDYQIEAIEAWKENARRGILEMATGTGKTFTSITAIKEQFKYEKSLLCIIACPFQHLVTQWSDELVDQKLDNMKVYGNKNSWKDKLMDKILEMNSGIRKQMVVVTTYDTLSSDTFTQIMRDAKCKIMIVGDEVHSVGSEKRRDGLLETYSLRLGLSATPSRWLDDEGTEIIMDYFGKSVFKFDLDKAIDSKFLTQYLYYPHFIELTDAELKEYKEYGKKIAIAASKNDEGGKKALDLLLIKRKKIITNARNKIPKFIEILDSLNRIEKCLVYCSPNQISEVKDILANKKVMYHRFTSKENIKMREEIKEDFASGKYDALVAMKCLDEGVDIPATETGIILASSGNPKEYIQRRGRLLRRFPGKTKAIIHDIIVVPSFNVKLDKELLDCERKILKNELKRYQEFSESSLNPLYGSKIIIKIQDLYGL